jgi:predicted nicotinamide N-methyase
MRSTNSGRKVTMISRTLPIDSDRIQNITVWEWKDPSEVVNAYWDAQCHQMTTMTPSLTAVTSSGENYFQRPPLLDPFGFIAWPGAVRAAQQLCQHATTAVQGRHVVILGAGVGVETQAAAILGAKQVTSTDIHPTTLQQLVFGLQQEEEEGRIAPGIVQTKLLDVFASSQDQPLPTPCDLLVVADVLYNEQLAKQVCRRCVEAYQQNLSCKILITDSQRFVPRFIHDLNVACETVAEAMGIHYQKVAWHVETMKAFTGSGVIIDEDQTYDVKVGHLWIGL